MSNAVITIGVACYNNEKFLSECLDSIISQQGDDIEIVIVDDASTDSSFEICKRYAEKDGRIRLFRHEKNMKLAVTRNTTIDNATGQWITFVDGDDLLTADAIKIFRRYCGSEADLVVFHHDTIDDGSISHGSPRFQAEILNSKQDFDFFKFFLLSRVKKRFYEMNIHSAWAKLWKTDFLNRNMLRFDPKVIKSQDTVFNYLCAHYYSCVEIVPACTYVYRKNGDSICARFQSDIHLKNKLIAESTRDLIEGFGENDNRTLMQGYYLLCLYLVKITLTLGCYHPDCFWNRAERLAWLNEVCSFEWVREMCEHHSGISCEKPEDRKLLEFMWRSKLERLDMEYHAKAVFKRLYRNKMKKYALFRTMNSLRKMLAR